MLSDDVEYITFVSTGASVGVGVDVSDTAETVEDEAAEEDEAAASAAFFRPLLNPLEKTPTIRKNRTSDGSTLRFFRGFPFTRSSTGSFNVAQSGTRCAYSGCLSTAATYRMMNTFPANRNTNALIGDVQFDAWSNFLTLFESHTHNDSPSLEV